MKEIILSLLVALAVFKTCPAKPTEENSKKSLVEFRQILINQYASDPANPVIADTVVFYNSLAHSTVKKAGGKQLFFSKSYGEETITIVDPFNEKKITVKKDNIKPIALLDFEGNIIKGKGKGLGIMPTLPPKNPLDRTQLPFPPTTIITNPPTATQ